VVLERFVSLRVGAELDLREAEVLDRIVGMIRPDPYDPLTVRIREGPQEDAVERGKDRDAGAETHGGKSRQRDVGDTSHGAHTRTATTNLNRLRSAHLRSMSIEYA